MKLYLSSYKLGNDPRLLAGLFSNPHPKVAYIPNALDFTKTDWDRRNKMVASDIFSLRELGFQVSTLDLIDYFGQSEILAAKLSQLEGIFVSGGSVFILRQAMKLSGLDTLLCAFKDSRPNFVYAGYSAAGCVLSPTLKAYQIVDDPRELPYPQQRETIWEGLGIIKYAFLPHFESDHHEAADIEKERLSCIEQGLAFRTLRDGEVFIS